MYGTPGEPRSSLMSGAESVSRRGAAGPSRSDGVAMRCRASGLGAAVPISRVAAGGGVGAAAIVRPPSPGPGGGGRARRPPRLTWTSCCGELTDDDDGKGASSAIWANPGDASGSPGRTANAVASGGSNPPTPSPSASTARASRRWRRGNEWPSQPALRATSACTATTSTSPGEPAARHIRRSASQSPVAEWPALPTGGNGPVMSEEPARHVGRDRCRRARS